VYQYDLHKQVTFSSSGTAPITYSAVAKNKAAFDSTSVNDLIYAVLNDGALNSATGVYPKIAAVSSTKKHLAQLWLLNTAINSGHAIHTVANLTANHIKWTASNNTAESIGTANVAQYQQTKLSPDNNATASFMTADVVDYVLSTTQSVTYQEAQSASVMTYYLNKATSTTNGTLNGDALLSSFTGFPSTLDLLVNTYSLGRAALRLLGYSLQSVYDYFKNSTPITPSEASSAGWSSSDIVGVFPFADLTSNGGDYIYVPFSATDATTNRKLVDNFLTLYQSGSNGSLAFRTGVNNRYRTLNQLSLDTSAPSGADSQRNAVISYLLYNMVYGKSSPGATQSAPYTSATETAAFVSTLLPAGSTAITHKSLFHVAEAAGYSATTKARANFSVADLVKTFKYMPKEVRNNNSGADFKYYDYNGNASSELTVSRWPESLVLNTWGCDDIFASSVSVTDTQTGKTDIYYPVSIVSALKGSDGVRDIITTDANGAYIKQNYDGIPYSAIANKVGEARVVADVVAGFKNLVTSITTVDNTAIAAVFDALNLTSAQAKLYIGQKIENTTTVSLVTISMMANLSPYQRRALFAGIASAANQYSLAGLTTEQFLRLGYSSEEWSTYITGGNVSVNVSLYDLLSATEDVTVLDSDFYLSSTTVKRAIFHTLASRKALVKAFMPSAKDEEQERIALAPFADIPRP
jgi:hypothetical protein